jgi:PhnB protein
MNIPGGKSTVTPYVAAKGAARFLDFVEEVFTTNKAFRVPNEDGTIGHSEIRIGESVIMAFDSRPEWPQTPSFLSLDPPTKGWIGGTPEIGSAL